MSLCRFAWVWLLLVQLPLWGSQAVTITFASPEQLVQAGAKLGTAAAQELEAQVEKNPEDLSARAQLLGYYYYQWMRPGEAAAKAARRRHILWLIENHPEAPVTGLSEATIDETGNAMADQEGYQQARKLWLSQMETGKSSSETLGNVARFFQLSDRDLAESALLRARTVQPQNPEWDWRLGNLYAMGILGVDTMGLNGQPTSVDPFAQSGPFAAKSRKALAESSSGTMLGVAASTLSRYGAMLSSSEKGKVDYVDQAIGLVQRAKAIEPGNPSWPQFLAQLQAYRRQLTR